MIICENIALRICPKSDISEMINSPIKTVETMKLLGNSEYMHKGEVERKKFQHVRKIRTPEENM